MNVTLRKWNLEDIDQLVAIANNKKIADNLTNNFPHPYTRESGEGFIDMALAQDPTCIFCIDIDGIAWGATGLHVQPDLFCKNMELGYWLAEAQWGKGVMSSAVRQIVEYGFDVFDINRIFARPFHTNIGSQKVLEKAGFTLEGRFEKTIFKSDKYYDELVYAIRK